MNPIKEFAVFDGKEYAASTRRVYVSAAKKALKIAGKSAENSGSYEELLALLRENLVEKKFPKALKIAPFLSFLRSKIPKDSDDIADFEPIRIWVTDRVAEETKAARASHFIRRDLAMLAGLCVAPGKGSPRYWPKSALAVKKQKSGGIEVKVWDRDGREQRPRQGAPLLAHLARAPGPTRAEPHPPQGMGIQRFAIPKLEGRSLDQVRNAQCLVAAERSRRGSSSPDSRHDSASVFAGLR